MQNFCSNFQPYIFYSKLELWNAANFALACLPCLRMRMNWSQRNKKFVRPLTHTLVYTYQKWSILCALATNPNPHYVFNFLLRQAPLTFYWENVVNLNNWDISTVIRQEHLLLFYCFILLSFTIVLYRCLWRPNTLMDRRSPSLSPGCATCYSAPPLVLKMPMITITLHQPQLLLPCLPPKPRRNWVKEPARGSRRKPSRVTTQNHQPNVWYDRAAQLCLRTEGIWY